MTLAANEDPETTRIYGICNDSLRAGIKCAKEGQPPCETCEIMKECKAAKEALDELWKQKGR